MQFLSNNSAKNQAYLQKNIAGMLSRKFCQNAINYETTVH